MDRRTEGRPRVGFWCPVGRGMTGDPALPDPRQLVDLAWDPAIKAKVVSYLEKGRAERYYRGWSYCRFHCGIPDRQMGSHDYSDGMWVWPQGLAHYVEVHSVRLPNEFLAHLQSLDFEFPAHPEEETHSAAEFLHFLSDGAKAKVDAIPLPPHYAVFARDLQRSRQSLVASLWHKLTERCSGQ